MKKSQCTVGLEFFNCRTSEIGTVIKHTDDMIIMQFSNRYKTITPPTFKRWYRRVPEDGVIPDNTISKKILDYDSLDYSQMSGDLIVAKFLQVLKKCADQDLDFTFSGRSVIVKYNGYNVFEMYVGNKKLNVHANSKALTADNYRRAYKIYPKEWSWPLNVKFVFTHTNEWPLMKTIIVDSLFYRQREEK